MDKIYCPNYIEKTVQKYWNDHHTFSVTENNNKPKYYCLSMLPYPSGKLHMGHVRNYTIGDVISRYNRMLGKNVLQPIGWDAFGLPAEQAAITNHIQPAIWTYSNIEYMKNQLKTLGFSYDWNREIITCQPKYYKWEQWFFIVLYKKGLAYKKIALVNWCPYHKTVLANEQVINNCCWRCNSPIKYKKISQWFIKITNYADQLLDGLDTLKYWPEKVKTMQRNWIGRSEGMNIIFKIANNDKDILIIYTKRLDLIMGVTYLSISTDHPIALKIAKNNQALSNFLKKYNDLFNQLNKNNTFSVEKQGIFTNIYAIHPITYKKLPIWVVNFLTRMEFDGMGAKMSIPAHNRQDWEFAHLYNLPIKPVLKKINSVTESIINQAIIIHNGVLFNSGYFDGLSSTIASNLIAKVLIQRKLAQYKVNFNLKDWGISRQRYWGAPIPIVYLKNGIIKSVSDDQLPVVLPEDIKINNDISNILKQNSHWMYSTYEGQQVVRDTDTFDTFIESSWYYARYTCPHYNDGMLDTRVANYWLPVDQYIGGIEHSIMHLMYFRFYHKLMRDVGLVNSDEPAVRLLCQGMVLTDSFYYLSHNGQRIWVSPNCIKKIYRNKIGHIIKATDIYGNNLIHAGMCKMSKSKNNGVDPNFIVKKYGADAVRFFIMFAAPPESSLEWKENGLKGAYRFLQRIWNLVYQHIKNGTCDEIDISKLNKNQKLVRLHIYRTVSKVTDCIDRRQAFNSALSEIMKLVNVLYNAQKNNMQDRSILQEALLILVRLLYPFTPHISFILWKALGENDIDNAKWPTVDTKAMQDSHTLIIVQINGKTRHKLYVPFNSDECKIRKILEKENSLKKYFLEKKICRVIFINNRIINFII